MRSTMRSTIPGHFCAWCMAGLGRLWYCTQQRTVRRAPRERGCGSCLSSKVGGRMRSSSGPCGLSAQRLFASAISSAAAGEARATRNTSSKRIRAIAAPKAQQGPGYSARNREDFEKLAHLRRGKQLVRLGGERGVMQGALDIRFAEHFRDAAIDEELRLRGVTEDLEPGVARGVGEGAEVDIGAHVLLAGVQERVAMRPVTVMAHQSARRALRVVVLVPR